MNEYNESRILDILQSVLGVYFPIKNEYKFYCPWCHHHKPKLQLNIQEQKYHCWVCNSRGRSLYYLLRQLDASPKLLEELSKYVGKPTKQSSLAEDKTEHAIFLPREFITLAAPSSDIDYNLAMSYLRNRNISYEDIVKHNIGFCPDGIYRGRIIIPSYDGDRKLNYFVARSYYPHESFKYKNPPVSRNIVTFDLQTNWNEPITLCEGVFDAIAIKRNAIPLLGKTVSPKLHEKIITKRVKKLSIALDTDAKNDALKIADRYMKEGINVTVVNLPGKDPSDIGFNEYEKLTQNISTFGFSDLIKQKLYG